MTFNMINLRGKVQQVVLAFLFLAIPSSAQTIPSMVGAVSDSAIFSTIAGLQGFGTRYYYDGNALQVSEWVRQQFLAAGVTEVVLDTFLCNTTTQANVVASLAGSRYPEREIILGAHIDSRTLPIDNAPGADDDASGTAAILEIARVLIASGYHPLSTIRFIGFAAEEPGLVGSLYYASRARSANTHIILMINFDMIGYTTASDPERRFNIIHYSQDTGTPDRVASAATSYTSLKPVITTVSQTNVDSYSFAMQRYDAVTCSEFLSNPFYHSPGDVISTLDSSYVREITQVGLATILSFDGAPTSIGSKGGDIPLAMKLYQNYPNPFNPRTSIQYTVGVAGPALRAKTRGPEDRSDKWQVAGGKEYVANVKLAVYDLLGREVAVLVNERKTPGSYEVAFDGSGLSSGFYIYRLSAGSFVQTRTMLLIK